VKHNIGYRLSAIGYRLSAISYRLAAIGYQLLAIGYRHLPSDISRPLSQVRPLGAQAESRKPKLKAEAESRLSGLYLTFSVGDPHALPEE
jgi:hypothetical protein